MSISSAMNTYSTAAPRSWPKSRNWGTPPTSLPKPAMSASLSTNTSEPVEMTFGKTGATWRNNSASSRVSCTAAIRGAGSVICVRGSAKRWTTLFLRYHDDTERLALRANHFREGVDEGAVHCLRSRERGRCNFWIAGRIQVPDTFDIEIGRRVREQRSEERRV